jgi:hypothetical protein
MKFLIASLVFVVAAFGASASAAPAGPDIKSYFGEWRGVADATSETDEDFPKTKRDIALTIAPTDLGGFTLSWSTLQRQKGDPKAPLEVLKSTTVEFVPSVEDNQWRAKAEADPYVGGIIYFARLDSRGLTVSSFTIARDGKPEYQTYRRTVVGNAMRLEFTNVKDGKFVRTVKGQLSRSSGKPH